MIDLFKNGMALVKISVIISVAFMVNKLIFFGSVHYFYQSKTPTSMLVTKGVVSFHICFGHQHRNSVTNITVAAEDSYYL